MPEYLLFRPPRRQPRVLAVVSYVNQLALAVVSYVNQLALAVSDPWELRYVAEHPLPLNPDTRLDRCQVLIQETLVRERPQVLAVIASRSTARKALRQLAKHFGLPLVELPPERWKAFLAGMKKDAAFFGDAFWRNLPERHVSKRLMEKKLLRHVALLAHAALSSLLQQSYERQSHSNQRQPWRRAVAGLARPLQAGEPQSTPNPRSVSKP